MNSKIEDTQKIEDDKRHQLFTTIPLRLIAEIRKHFDSFSIVDNNIFPPNVRRARDYLLSGMINEVEKAMISCLHTSDFILDSKKTLLTQEQIDMRNEIPWLESSIFQSRIDEMVLWERKLTEQLVDIVGLKHVNDDNYSRHYIILREIERLKNIKDDFKEYFNADNKNIQDQIDDLKERVKTLIPLLDTSKCWYVDSINSRGEGQYKIATYKKRLNKALLWMSPNQRLLVGISYGGYNEQSSSMHPNLLNIQYRKPTMDTLDDHFMRVAILSQEVVFCVKDSMKLNSGKGWFNDIAKKYKLNDYPKEIIKDFSKPGINKGDFVIAVGDLAEVIKINKSMFGYRSFRIKYLVTPPIPSIPVDEIPANYVHLYYKRKPMSEKIIKLLIENGEKKPSKRTVNLAINDTIIDFWTKMGGKEFAEGNQKAGYDKMSDFQNKLKS